MSRTFTLRTLESCVCRAYPHPSVLLAMAACTWHVPIPVVWQERSAFLFYQCIALCHHVQQWKHRRNERKEAPNCSAWSECWCQKSRDTWPTSHSHFSRRTIYLDRTCFVGHESEDLELQLMCITAEQRQTPSSSTPVRREIRSSTLSRM